MSIEIVKGDITKLNVDCIVNAANSRLQRGDGVCGAIFRACGPKLDGACAKLGGCEIGGAKMTSAFDLPIKYVCHAVGPIYTGDEMDGALLASAYKSSLELAVAYGCSSIAFPCISTGIYGYPLKEACEIAFDTVMCWLKSHNDCLKVVLCCFDDNAFDTYNMLSEVNRG